MRRLAARQFMLLTLLGSLLAIAGLLGPAANPAGAAPKPAVTASGYDMVGSDGGIFVFPGGQPGGFYGSLPGLHVTVNNIVGMVPSFDYRGYFLVGSDGGVFSFGDTHYEGSLPGLGVRVNNIVGIVPSSDDRGYFLVGADGGVFTFGDAHFEGSLPGMGTSVNDIVSIASTPDNRGYLLLGSDGSIYSFGDAPPNYGGLYCPGPNPCYPVVSIVMTSNGQGFWVTASNGKVYPFPSDANGNPDGSAGWFGDLSASGNVTDIVALVPSSDDKGYMLVGSDGGAFVFGDFGFQGSLPSVGVHVDNVVGAVPTVLG